MSRAAVAGLALWLAFAGCKREEQPPPQEDRTLSKLKVEVDRANAGGVVVRSPAEPHDPNANLAALAVGNNAERGTEGPLTIPDAGAVKSGPIAVSLVSATTSHQLQGAKMSLTSEELFVRVDLTARNEGSVAEPFTIERAKLVAGEKSWPIARDAHFLVGTRQVGFDAPPGETRPLTLVFEVPPSALQSESLVLELPQGEGRNGDVRLRLK